MMLNFEEKRRLCEILKMFHILLQLQLLIIAGAHPSFARDVFLLIFSVTRRSRSDIRQLLTYSLTESVSVSTDLTDVTLVSDDTY